MKNKKITMTASLFILLFSFSFAQVLAAEKKTGGNIIGHIYGLKKTRPISSAVIKAKNIKDGTLYVSNPSNSRGEFKIKGIKSGIYIIGVKTRNGEFNTEQLVGVYEGQTLRVAFSLNPYSRKFVSAIKNVYRNIMASGECYIGEIVKYLNNPGEAVIQVQRGVIQVGDRIHVKGYMTDFIQEVEELYVDGIAVDKALVGQKSIVVLKHPVDIGDFIYLIPKRRGLNAFFLAPTGIASVVASSSAFAYGFVTLVEKEPEESKFKNKK